MTDIMQDWKDTRFVFVSPELFPEQHGHIIVLSDVAYWNEHYEELQLWCRTNNSVIRGMTVTVPDDASMSLFCLRWK